MKQELIENTVFMRYYEKWQRDPTSVVFAAISEMFRDHGLPEDAVRVAEEGLKHHPNLISGRIALAKAYLAIGETTKARDEAVFILTLMPANQDALNIIHGEQEKIVPQTPSLQVKQMIQLPETSEKEVDEPTLVVHSFTQNTFGFEDEEITEEMPISEIDEMAEVKSVTDSEHWQTLTMAKILESQGHFARARRIYKAILEREPDNQDVVAELVKCRGKKENSVRE